MFQTYIVLFRSYFMHIRYESENESVIGKLVLFLVIDFGFLGSYNHQYLISRFLKAPQSTLQSALFMFFFPIKSKHTSCLSIFPERLGYFPSSPGLSCKQIRDSGDSGGDGKYWIDPENNGNPLQVYCDMTTDGGDYFISKNGYSFL